MIDLYALTSPNVQKVYVMLEECGLPYKEHFVDVWKGDQYKPEFAKVNPNNKIPAIVDHDGPGGKPYTVIESGAILMYLAEKSGKFLPKDMAKKYDVMQWLMIQLTGVGPMFGQWTHFKLFAPKTGNDYSMTRYTSEIKRLYEVLEKRLGEVPYLGGQDYSIADIATFPWTRNHDAQGVKWEDNPNLARWFKSIDERPAVKAALAKIAAIKSNRETATDDRRTASSIAADTPGHNRPAEAAGGGGVGPQGQGRRRHGRELGRRHRRRVRENPRVARLQRGGELRHQRGRRRRHRRRLQGGGRRSRCRAG